MKARQAAYQILCRVLNEHGYASLLMRQIRMNAQDMAFVSEVVYGTLRNYTLVSYQWQRFAEKTDKNTLVLLAMSIYQLFYMDGTPDYAVIHEAVELAGKNKKRFVNAILRRVQEAGLQIPDDPSIALSHPQWLLGLWQAHYGKKTALEIAHHNQKASVVYGRINTLKADKDQLIKEGFRFLDEQCLVIDMPITRTRAFAEGEVVVQARSSQQAVQHLELAEGLRVLDLCAAPGTKTQQIAMMMHDKGTVVACDLYEHRLNLIDALMQRTCVTIVETKLNDATKENVFAPASFDRILIDAPCSGLGDLSHKPEIRWHLKPEDIDSVVLVQKQILEASASYLKQNGIMVYSTCTLNKKENEKQVEAFVSRHPEYVLLEEQTIFPDMYDSDGFYYAKLKRMV